MQVRLDLCEPGDGEVAVIGGQGSLKRWRLEWVCAGIPLKLLIVAEEPIALPAAEPSEPVPSAIARVLQSLHGHQALLALLNPAEALGVERILLAEGVRLFAITNDADLACWHAALDRQVPVYALRGVVVCDLVRPTASNALSALAYGAFTACEGLVPNSIGEDRQGLRWDLPEVAETTIVIRGGFEAECISGAQGAYVDRGHEGWVRAEMTSASGSCWTQPRFVAPRK
jgi:hypothetical protein